MWHWPPAVLTEPHFELLGATVTWVDKDESDNIDSTASRNDRVRASGIVERAAVVASEQILIQAEDDVLQHFFIALFKLLEDGLQILLA